MKTSAFLLCLATIAWIPLKAEYAVETQFGYEAEEEVEIIITRTDTSDAVTFKVRTQDGVGPFDAVAPADYTALPETELSFDAGVANTSVNVILVDDVVTDPGEFFKLLVTDFSDGTAAFEAQIFIVDSQAVAVNCPGYLWAREHDEKFELTLRRSFLSRFGRLTFVVSTRDIVPAREEPIFLYMLYYAFAVTDTAVQVDDYTPTAEVVTLENGELEKTITINITDDVEGEPTKAFYVGVTGSGVGTCLFPAIISDDDIPDFFHCGRGESQPCMNGGICNKEYGICVCPRGFGGPDCRLTEGEPEGCDDRCGDHGTCRSTGGSPVRIYCECHVGWSGAFCNYTAFNVKCNKNSFGVCFTPYSYENFKGVMYVQGKRNVPECQLTPAQGWPEGEAPEGADGSRPVDNDNIQSWCQGFAMELPFSGPCGDYPPIFDGSLRRHEAHFITQYSKIIYTHLDEWVTLRCELDGTRIVYESGDVAVDSSTSFLKKQTSINQAKPITMSIFTPGMQLEGTIPLNQRIVNCVSVEASTMFNCVIIKRIDVNNARSGDDYRTTNLYNEGCIKQSMRSVFVALPKWKMERGIEQRHTECYTILPFVFPSDFGQANIRMGIVITAIIPDECSRFTCESADRKKREATREEELNYILSIDTRQEQDVNTETADNGDADSFSTNPSEKESQWSMEPLIIGCAVGGSVFFISLIFALCFLCRRRDKLYDVY